MNKSENWLKFKWIEVTGESPVTEQRIVSHKPLDVKIEIYSFGFFELFVNGARVDESYCKPVWSNYVKRNVPGFDNDSGYCAYYHTYDLTPFWRDGENVLNVMLANGWYRQRERNVDGYMPYGETLKLGYAISVREKDGVKSYFADESLSAKESFVAYSNIFMGEKHDYKRCAVPCTVRPCGPPTAKSKPNVCKGDVVCERFAPKFIYKGKNGSIYDTGRVLSGFVETVSRGGDVCVRYAGVYRYGALDYVTYGGEKQVQTDEYVNTSDGQTLHPLFCLHGFRYFEIEGDVKQITVCDVHPDFGRRGDFSCDSEILNNVYQTYLRTQLANMHYGVPTDCPHRERLGYTADGWLTADAAMLSFEADSFYSKWIDDIIDSQDADSGEIPNTAPRYGGGGGAVGWGGAVVFVPYAYYMQTGDIDAVKKCLPAVEKWIGYIDGITKDGLVCGCADEKWFLGEWSTPEHEVLLPKEYVNTCLYAIALKKAEKLFEAAGETFCYLSKEKFAAMNAAVQRYRNDSGDYCRGVQGANLFALLAGFADENTRQRTLAHYENTGMLDTGIFGTYLLFDFLSESGRADIVERILLSTEFPSFGFMLSRGATCLWEHWADVGSSDCHPMYGGCLRHLHYTLLGIRPVKAGWSEVEIIPPDLRILKKLRGYVRTPQGKIRMRYDMKKKTAVITVPKKTIATLRIGKKEQILLQGENRLTL